MRHVAFIGQNVLPVDVEESLRCESGQVGKDHVAGVVQVQVAEKHVPHGKVPGQGLAASSKAQ